MIYLLDANTLIEAKNKHYGMDFCPAYWEFLDNEAGKTTLASIDMVLGELEEYGDSLSEWSKEREESLFIVHSESEDIQKKFIEIADYVNQHKIYSESEKARFLSGADPWLIAAGNVLGASIVTHEALVPSNSTKVKIPNVAKEFNVSWIDPFEMIRGLGGIFGLL